MTSLEVIEFGRLSILVMFRLALPLLLTALVVGLIIAILQTLTQVQEATLTFVPKIIVVFFLFLFILPYMGSTLGTYVVTIADRIIGFGVVP